MKAFDFAVQTVVSSLEHIQTAVWHGLAWFITGAGKCHYVCVVVTAPLQRHPTVPIFAAGSGFESEVTAQRTLAFVVLWTLQTDPQLHYTPRSVSSFLLSLSLSFCATRPRVG